MIRVDKDTACATLTLSGYRLTLNQGQDSGQEIEHLHLHLMAGRKLSAMG